MTSGVATSTSAEQTPEQVTERGQRHLQNRHLHAEKTAQKVAETTTAGRDSAFRLAAHGPAQFLRQPGHDEWGDHRQEPAHQ